VIGDTLSYTILKKEIHDQLKRPVYFLALIPVFILAQYYYFNIIGVRSLENDSATFDIGHFSYIFNELGFLMISLTGCATFIVLSFLIEKWNRWKWLRIIGFHSLYIYIMHVIVVAFARSVFIKFLGIDNYLVILFSVIILGVAVPIIFYNLIGKKYFWFLFSIKKEKANVLPKFKETNMRTSELRIPPLRSSVNNI
jgi:fucose 4-O-acetylase-like acetyltransferase